MSTSAQNPGDPGWSNPVVPQRADPWVYRHTDGFYYLTATAPEYDRIELRRAETIGGLATAPVKTIWRKHDTGPMSHHIWAPEIHYIDGKWYIYFTASQADDIWKLRLHVLECAAENPLEAEWVERGKLTVNWESFTLDATTFEHNGTRYLAWTQRDDEHRGTHIFLAEMDTPTSITGEAIKLTRPQHDWERRGHWVNEGPAVLIRNGKVFMTYSASATDANYCVGLLTADADADLMDPASWHKSEVPVFKSSPENSVFGPGHNSFTTTPDGQTDIIVYHARNYEKINGEPLHNPDRSTRAQPFTWNDDGTPNFGEPMPDGPVPLDKPGRVPR